MTNLTLYTLCLVGTLGVATGVAITFVLAALVAAIFTPKKKVRP